MVDKHNPYPTVWINGKQHYLHRVIAVKARGGVPLDDDECVHHRDENKENNDPDNLMIMRSNADHIALHGGNEPNYDPIRKHWFCEDRKMKIVSHCKCGAEIYGYAKYCSACYKQNKAEHIPNAQVLEYMIYKQRGNFTALGKTYGISDNGVRKWCKKYGPSYKSRNYKHGLVA